MRRVRRAYAVVRQALVERDVLGLRPRAAEERVRAAEWARMFAPPRLAPGDAVSPRMPVRRAFQHSPPADRLAAFNQFTWETLQEELLGIVPGLPSRGGGERSWQRRHLDRAMGKGRKDAQGRWKRAGGGAKAAGDILSGRIPGIIPDAMLDQRAERLAREARAELVRQQSFTELEGISDAMSARISRIIADGVLSGDSPAEIARDLARGADIDIGRARTIARTETIRAYNEAALQEFEEAGAAGVEMQVEWATAGDEVVCPECEAEEGKVYTLEEAHGKIPLHPNCRCAWLPVVREPEVAALPEKSEYEKAFEAWQKEQSELEDHAQILRATYQQIPDWIDDVRTLTPRAGPLNREELAAVSIYTGAGYGPMNRSLRAGDKPSGTDTLDAAVEAGRLAQDVVLYRGAGRLVHEELVQLQVGDGFYDRGFVSTSYSLDIAKGWNSLGSMRIFAARGSRALLVAPISQHRSEREVLLPRNTKMQFLGQSEGFFDFRIVEEK